MALLNIIPLFGGLLALLLGLLIIFRSRQNIKARWTLGIITILNAHSLIESYLYYNGYDEPWLGLSYLHYHLIGFLFLIYSFFLFRISTRIRVWIGVVLIFSVCRLLVLDTVTEDVLEATNFTPQILALTLDNLLSILLNAGLLVLAYIKIRKVKFTVDLSRTEQINYNWLKSLLMLSIVLYIAILLLNVISVFDEEWLIYFKMESVINSLFALSLVYASMRIPVFSIHGDYLDLDAATRKKYMKSSLSESDSTKLWAEMQQMMQRDKPFLNPEFRLSDLAEAIGKSVHHVSQAINEREGMSFSDFINQYRVKEAIALLEAGRTREVTIMAVSLEAGFNSKTAFYNAFKRETGKTPTAYLKEK